MLINFSTPVTQTGLFN